MTVLQRPGVDDDGAGEFVSSLGLVGVTAEVVDLGE